MQAPEDQRGSRAGQTRARARRRQARPAGHLELGICLRLVRSCQLLLRLGVLLLPRLQRVLERGDLALRRCILRPCVLRDVHAGCGLRSTAAAGLGLRRCGRLRGGGSRGLRLRGRGIRRRGGRGGCGCGGGSRWCIACPRRARRACRLLGRRLGCFLGLERLELLLPLLNLLARRLVRHLRPAGGSRCVRRSHGRGASLPARAVREASYPLCPTPRQLDQRSSRGHGTGP